jgi:hypothetical protein
MEHTQMNARILRLASQVADRFTGYKDSAEAALYFTRRIAENEMCDDLAFESIMSSVWAWICDAADRNAYNDEYQADCDNSL